MLKIWLRPSVISTAQDITYTCNINNMSYVCMYICAVIKFSKGKDQPGKIANPARGQLKRENMFFPVPVRA